MEIPEIRTERLVLRGFTAADFDRFDAIWSDPAVTAQVGVPPADRAAHWDSLMRNAGNWALLGHGQWAICDAETGRVLGQTGFFRRLRGHGPDFDAFPEAGWVLAPEAHRKGIGPEATRAAHGWFDAHIGGPSVAQIAPANAASRSVAARLGYVAFRESAEVLLLRREGAPAG